MRYNKQLKDLQQCWLKVWRRESSGYTGTHFISVDNTKHQQ